MTEQQKALLSDLGQGLAADKFTSDKAECWTYGHDYSRRHAPPDVVVFAHCHDDVAHAVQCCVKHKVPIIPHGGASGATGGCVPEQGGLVLSLESMNKILTTNFADRYMVVEGGTINQTVQEEAKKGGFFWPPDPTSSGYSTIGGNLACNAAGPMAVKYGSCRENTLGLKAVTGSGETIQTGTCTSKSSVGYDLTRLLIGNEGTLAIITEATLKLTPLPPEKISIQLLYNDLTAATEAVSAIMAQPDTPCALEFMDEGCLQVLQDNPDIQLPQDSKALLIIEIDGHSETIPFAQKNILAAAKNTGLIETTIANDQASADKIWGVRKALPAGLRKLAPRKINEDVVVPVSQIPTLIAQLKQLSDKHAIPIVNFGHAGNGNLHVNLLINPDSPQANNAQACLSELFDMVLSLSGSLSGEHGIGLEKKPFFSRQIDHNSLKLMRDIKKLLDPHQLLNPGKIFDM